jgi:copper resistance protein B
LKGWRAGAASVLALGLSTGALAQTAGAASGDAAAAAPFGMPMDDSRIFAHLLVDQFEARLGATDAFWWAAQAWMGTDENRLYLLTEGERANGKVSDGEDELLYARPISAFFDVQAGIRSDLDSAHNRTWAAVGIAGLAPYFLQLSGTVYASDGGHYAAKGTASYDLLFTQRLILTPAIELNAYSRRDSRRQTDSGLSGIEAGLRLRYELSRKFAPYLGVSYQRNVAPGSAVNATRVALGMHAWL